tara:strand:+ start:1465 stop:3996 length:2532 start_codon:yes stop_codon:yes gene_type:complete
MAINYTQAFNAGEISRKMDGRNDLEVYKTGCRDLDNFFVLPQGGVERRAGTEFIQFAGTDGTNPARMIEFDFSSDIRFVIELGTDYAKVHYTDDLGVDQVVNVTETDNINYTTAELRQIQFNRKYDTLILTCSTKETMILTRDTITPTFSIKEIDYVYPPLMEKNITSTTLDLNNGAIGATSVTVTASADLFDSGHENSIWAIDHIRSASEKEISESSLNGTSTNILDVSFSNWAFETSGNWNAEVVIHRSIDGGTFIPYIVIGNTTGGTQRNFKYASSVPEGKNTKLKVVTSGSLDEYSLEADNIYHKGLIKITSVTDATTATADIVSMVQGGAADPTATIHWSEGAFSTYRGFSPASEFFENRLWLAGSKDQPADIFASVFSEIFNFLSGTLSTDAIKRTIDSPEEPKWLESKRYLFLGTAGTAVSIRSADRDSLITQTNITTLVENAYGSAALQAEVANDVIIYVQRDGLKLRELVYAQGEDTFVGNDLNLISEDITDSGVVEMFVQKEPNQFVWCIKENGDACVLTYERGQQVRGWGRVNTDGKFFSAAAIHDSGEDVVWACIERNGKYCIEKFHTRKDLDWYVDSGKTVDNSALSFSDITLTLSGSSPNQKFTFVQSSTSGLNADDVIKVSGLTAIPELNNKVFKIIADSSNFKLVQVGTTTEIRPPFETSNTTYTVSIKKVTNTVTGLSHLNGKTVQVVVDGSYHSDQTVAGGSVTAEYGNKLIAGLPYTSTLRPMPIEPSLYQKLSQSRVKAIAKIIVRFFKTKGAKVGEAGRQLTTFPVVDTQDPTGQIIELKTGQQRFFVGSDYEREKLIEVRQDLPYPMTVLSIASHVNAEGA